MRTRHCLLIVAAFCLMLVNRVALAYYNPQTGRFLSRDPIEELGFQVAQNANMGAAQAFHRTTGMLVSPSPVAVVGGVGRAYDTQDTGRRFPRDPVAIFPGSADDDAMLGFPPSLYIYVHNAPIGSIDPLGLKEVETGVILYNGGLWIFNVHGGIKVDGKTCGFWPEGGTKLRKFLTLFPLAWVQGHVYQDDLMPPENEEPFKLDDCKYDISKFKSCVSGECTDKKTGHYNLYFHNCRHWRGDVIKGCTEKSKLSSP